MDSCVELLILLMPLHLFNGKAIQLCKFYTKGNEKYKCNYYTPLFLSGKWSIAYTNKAALNNTYWQYV